MLDEHGGSTDDGVRFDMSSENCRVVRHLFSRFLEHLKKRVKSSPETRDGGLGGGGFDGKGEVFVRLRRCHNLF